MVSRYLCAIRQRAATLNARSRKPDILVLMFHEVCPGDKAYDPNFSISFSNFKTLISKLISSRKIVKLSEIDAYNYPVAAITFDDVYKNIFDEAVPYLIENGLPFELFICDELVNKDNYISDNQILLMRENHLCSISFHSKHHIFVSQLDRNQFINEISPAAFKEKYNLECQCFAYPFGSFFASRTKFVEEAKHFYKYAFSTINSGFSHSYLKKHTYFLPRINVCDSSIKSVIKKYLKKKGATI